jgi:hypothetical protein
MSKEVKKDRKKEANEGGENCLIVVLKGFRA